MVAALALSSSYSMWLGYLRLLTNIFPMHIQVRMQMTPKFIYHSFRPDTSLSQDAALKSIENCVADIRAWMLSNRLLINDSKTECIIIGSKQQLSKINIKEITVGESTIEPVEVVQSLGMWFDSHINYVDGYSHWKSV